MIKRNKRAVLQSSTGILLKILIPFVAIRMASSGLRPGTASRDLILAPKHLPIIFMIRVIPTASVTTQPFLFLPIPAEISGWGRGVSLLTSSTRRPDSSRTTRTTHWTPLPSVRISCIVFLRIQSTTSGLERLREGFASMITTTIILLPTHGTGICHGIQ